jgi:glycerol-3-phosphate cytidylyltransferase
MIYCFDLDGTLCTQTKNGYYTDIEPMLTAIKEVNRLYEEGHTVKIFTARGSTSGKDLTDITKKQLHSWGLNYSELILKKPSYDVIIDDRAINALEWHKTLGKRGIVAGCFDLIHPGYIKMFEDAKSACDHLVVALQSDPTVDRPDSHKTKPIQTVEERELVLSAIRWVDEIIKYNTEKELYEILKTKNIDVRILGSDYKAINYTGDDLGMEVYFHERSHEWSATNLKERIRK